MAQRTTEQKLAAKQKQLDALKKKARAEDTRRKILIGGAVLGLLQNHPHIADFLIDNVVLAERDKRLFSDHPHLSALSHPAQRDRYGNPI